MQKSVKFSVLLMIKEPRQGSSLGSWFGELREWQEGPLQGDGSENITRFPEEATPELGQLLQELFVSLCLEGSETEKQKPSQQEATSALPAQADGFFLHFISTFLHFCKSAEAFSTLSENMH